MLSFRASVFTNHCGGLSLSTPSPLSLINIEAFDEKISSRIYFTFSYELCEVNIVTGNIKNIVKNKPWSALYGSAALGCQLPSSAHKNLPTSATTHLTR